MPNDGSWIFVGSMGDTFCEGVDDEWIIKLLDFIKNCEANNKFLLQTKNPRRFEKLNLDNIKDKIILGTTLETTRATLWSVAPSTIERYTYLRIMKQRGFKTFLSLEPLSDFKLDEMKRWIHKLEPEAIEIGLENYTKFTKKPPDLKIHELLFWLDTEGIDYVLKENLQYLVPIGELAEGPIISKEQRTEQK